MHNYAKILPFVASFSILVVQVVGISGSSDAQVLSNKKLGDYCDEPLAPIDSIPFSMCWNYKYMCRWRYFERDGKCYQGFNTPCNNDNNSQCAAENSVCLHQRCLCDENSFYHLGTCVKFASEIGDACNISGWQCNRVRYSSCINGKCVASLHPPCKNSTDCCSYHSKSLSAKCKCPVGFHKSKGHCVKYPTELYDYCSENYACNKIGNSSCINNKCQCNQYFKERMGRCVPVWNHLCENLENCKKVFWSLNVYQGNPFASMMRFFQLMKNMF